MERYRFGELAPPRVSFPGFSSCIELAPCAFAPRCIFAPCKRCMELDALSLHLLSLHLLHALRYRGYALPCLCICVRSVCLALSARVAPHLIIWSSSNQHLQCCGMLHALCAAVCYLRCVLQYVTCAVCCSWLILCTFKRRAAN